MGGVSALISGASAGGSKLIPVTPGMFAIVDAEDYDRISRRKWYAHRSWGAVYANHVTRLPNGKRKTLFIHREVMGAKDGEYVDHIIRNGLDCRKKNLRLCTQHQNQGNRRKLAEGSSRFKGVCWHKNKKKWYASIKINNRSTHVGVSHSEKEAALMYNKAAVEFFGVEFALLNKVD